MRVTGDDTAGALIGISFDSAFRAQEFLLAARGLAAEDKYRLNDAVIVLKDANGRTMVQETKDLSTGRSAWSGAVWSGLFGLVIGGPVGWVAGTVIGAGTGAAAAKVVDLGITDEWVAWFRDEVKEETATVVLLIEDADRNAVVEEIGRFEGAELVYTSFEAETMTRISDALGGDIEVEHHDDNAEMIAAAAGETAPGDDNPPEPTVDDAIDNS